MSIALPTMAESAMWLVRAQRRDDAAKAAGCRPSPGGGEDGTAVHGAEHTSAPPRPPPSRARPRPLSLEAHASGADGLPPVRRSISPGVLDVDEASRTSPRGHESCLSASAGSIPRRLSDP